MPGKTKEPQSYGSQEDWVTGKTGQQPNDPKSGPTAEHHDFYDDQRESETNAPEQGGLNSAADVNEDPRPARLRNESPSDPLHNVTVRAGGAKRGSYFKRRDYE